MHYQSLGPVTKVSPAKCLGRVTGGDQEHRSPLNAYSLIW